MAKPLRVIYQSKEDHDREVGQRIDFFLLIIGFLIFWALYYFLLPNSFNQEVRGWTSLILATITGIAIYQRKTIVSSFKNKNNGKKKRINKKNFFILLTILVIVLLYFSYSEGNLKTMPKTAPALTIPCSSDLDCGG